MINIRKLIDFLPYYFKHKDTYKDENGKGILEKFLEVCGDYFTDNLLNVIGDTLDILDIEATTEYYLNYLWEILGQLPFANQTYVKPFNLTRDQQIALIKYGNAFLKIRGTRQFFEIVSSIYGWQIEITTDNPGWETDPIVGGNVLHSYHDTDYLDDDSIRFDEYYRMKQCTNARFVITGEFTDVSGAQKALVAFIEKYVPYNVNPTVVVNGTELAVKYDLLIEKLVNDRWIEASSTEDITNGPVQFRVSAIKASDKTTRYDGISFLSWINPSNKTVRVSPYTFTAGTVSDKENGDVYRFQIGSDTSTLKSLTIVASEKQYDSYSIRCNPTTAQLTVGGKVSTVVIGTINGNPARIYCNETKESKNSGSTWEFDKAGTYTFCLEANVKISTTFEVEAAVPIYSVQLAYRKYIIGPPVDGILPIPDWSSYSPYSNTLNVSVDNLSNLQVKIKITCNDPSVPDERLVAVLGSKEYKNGETFTPSSFSSFTYKAKYGNPALNSNATLTVTSESVSFNTYLLNSSTPSIITNDVKEVWATFIADPSNEGARRIINEGLLSFKVTLQNGQVINVENKKESQSYDKTVKVTWEGDNIIKVVTSTPGRYLVKADQSTNSDIATWDVDINIVNVQEATGIMIVPTNDKGWLTGTATDRTYQLSETDVEAKFKIVAVDNNGSIINIDGMTIYDQDDNYYQLDEEYTVSEPKDISLTANYGNKTFKATVHVKDFETVIDLRCTPSSATLVNNQASAKLSISSNKPGLLQIKEQAYGDLYKDGDTFITSNEGTFTFIAMVDGKEFTDSKGDKVTVTLKVEDPSKITVEPEILEWDPDDLSEKSITITTGSNTFWTLEQ